MKPLRGDQKKAMLSLISMRKHILETAFMADDMLEEKHMLQDLWDWVKVQPIDEELSLIEPSQETLREVNFAVMDKIGEIEKYQPHKWDDNYSPKATILKQLVLLRRGSRWLMGLIEEEAKEEFTV